MFQFRLSELCTLAKLASCDFCFNNTKTHETRENSALGNLPMTEIEISWLALGGGCLSSAETSGAVTVQV